MRKYLLLSLLTLVLLAGLFVYHFIIFNDNKLHVVFCNVGQGDGIFIRTPKGLDILVDGGPNDLVLSCLSKHMPFWDHKIELMILTHPHEDHLRGLLAVLDRYSVSSFYTENLSNKSLGFQTLLKTIEEKQIQKRLVFAGDVFRTQDGVQFKIITPTREFLMTSSPLGSIGESREFGSLSILVKLDQFSLLLTGDTQAPQLQEALQSRVVDSVDILQVPHHGSKTGVSEEVLSVLKPKLAVISVGAKNRYSHPAPQTLQLLEQFKIPIKRTDKDGEVEVVSQGKGFVLVR